MTKTSLSMRCSHLLGSIAFLCLFALPACVGQPDDQQRTPDGDEVLRSTHPLVVDPWRQLAQLSASDTASGDAFGMSVAISGPIAIVGAPNHGDAGSAYLFARNQEGSSAWSLLKKLTASDATSGDGFGGSVAISGDFAVVGAEQKGDAGINSGAAYLFARHQGGSDQWGQLKKLSPDDLAFGDSFGGSVAINADTILVGAAHKHDIGDYSGAT